MSGRVLNVNLTEFFNLSGQLVDQDVPAGTQVVIDFVARFSGIAKSVLLDNRDAVNVATYRVNSRAATLRTLRAAASRNLTVPIELIEINAGAADVVQMTAEVIPLELIEKRRKINAVQ